MKMIIEFFKAVGFILMGVLSLIILVFMLLVGALTLVGKFVAFAINMKIAEKWHKDEPAEVKSK